MQRESTQMLPVKAVAEMFAVSPQTIYRAIQAGELEASRVGPARRSVRITPAAVEEYRKLCRDAARPADSAGDSATGAAGGAR